jgi:hypothetical protein
MRALLLGLSVLALSMPAVAAADDYDRRVTVNNRTGQTIRQLFGSRTSTSDWEEDLLGDGVLRAGAGSRVNMDDGTGECEFDFKAVLADGSTRFRWKVNVCAVSQLTFGN